MPDGYTLVGIVVGDQSTNITANATIELVFRSEVMEDVD
jgi:mannose/fructose/N-acetylgalactosamine-specific phosphotransferase system component IIC